MKNWLRLSFLMLVLSLCSSCSDLDGDNIIYNDDELHYCGTEIYQDGKLLPENIYGLPFEMDKPYLWRIRSEVYEGMVCFDVLTRDEDGEYFSYVTDFERNQVSLKGSILTVGDYVYELSRQDEKIFSYELSMSDVRKECIEDEDYPGEWYFIDSDEAHDYKLIVKLESRMRVYE